MEKLTILAYNPTYRIVFSYIVSNDPTYRIEICTDAPFECSRAHELGHQNDLVAAVGTYIPIVVELDYVGMVEGLEHLRFIDKPLPFLFRKLVLVLETMTAEGLPF